MSFALRQSIAFLLVLLVVTAVQVPRVGATNEDKQLVPMVVNVDCSIQTGQSQCVANSPAIPAGKVFVIETISAFGERTSTGNLSVFLGITTGGTVAPIVYSWANQGVGVPGFAGRFVAFGPVATRYYADGGSTISVSAISGAGDFFTVTFSGHLITCDVTTGCALR